MIALGILFMVGAIMGCMFVAIMIEDGDYGMAIVCAILAALLAGFSANEFFEAGRREIKTRERIEPEYYTIQETVKKDGKVEKDTVFVYNLQNVELL